MNGFNRVTIIGKMLVPLVLLALPMVNSTHVLLHYLPNSNMSVVDLTACNIIENDVNNEVLWAWAFPNVTKQKQQFVIRKYNDISQSQTFAFAKYSKEWCYIITSQVVETELLSQVKQFALVIWSNDYNPEKYETLCRILSKKYGKTGNPSLVLQLYLSVMMEGLCNAEENGTNLIPDLESRKHFNSQIKDLIKLFGLETILIYTALLLNKKLVIYHYSLENLLKWVRSFPNLMLHRNFDNSTFPWVHLVADELDELKTKDGYIVGCTDSSIASRTDLYDIFVNLAAREVTIAPHTRESFVMTKTHKDIALFMVQLSEKASFDEQKVIEEIANKTKELLKHLRMLATVATPDGQKVISIETLRKKNLPPALENFLFNLSVAENMIML